MTTSEYADKIDDMIKTRPPKINPDKLLYEIYVRWKVAQGLRAVEEGRVYSHEQVREDMWRIIASKSSAHCIFAQKGVEP
ncbi:hypothetical protein HUU05_26140 [candidate division KSB1 bacterium]|nr:hypothetical protein [candidate division KSB1 bacterium]